MYQTSAKIEVTVFPCVWTLHIRSTKQVLFLSWPIIYCTNKLDYSIYSYNKRELCCHLSRAARKRSQILKSAFFSLCQRPAFGCIFINFRLAHSRAFFFLSISYRLEVKYTANTRKLHEIVRKWHNFRSKALDFREIHGMFSRIL